MSIFRSIVEAGLRDKLPDYIKKRVQPTNIVALTLATVIAIPFTVITLIYFPNLVVFPVGGAVVSLGCIWINHLGGIKYSRVIICIIPIILGASYNAALSGPTDDPLPSLYLIELSFALIPFVIFDSREWSFILFTIILCSIIILTFPVTKTWYTSAYDSTPLRNGWLSTLTISLAILGGFGCVMGMIFITKQSEKESEQSRVEAEQRNQVLLKQQEENAQKTKELEAAQAEERKRQWAAEGVAQISEIVRNTGAEDNLYDQLITSTVKYMSSNQGGLFVVDRSSNEVAIQLVACYAYERKKFLEKTISPGEGLIGQAYLEGEYLHFTEIPADYVNITSGLGQATPTSLLIVPLKVNEEVEGLLELAGFREFEEHEIEFLQRLGEVMASHIQNQRVMQQTQQLLAQAQEQGEEMRAQEEEMRQNMEELQATQEEMHRKEREYQTQIEKLKQELAETS
ncbi:MAG: GAF domain-containing protein [Cyclobacteriaceae bacterium]